jgi:uroporphyrinogen III methyltransferase/synthase
MNGCVYLVGAGPGDPGLLTRRAIELLADCDVVAYDELISDAVLALASPSAALVPVGHRGHGKARVPYKIHPAVIDEAKQGKRVVRLKQGDPFIFGRGGEEAEELWQAGIPFEVIPGISSALGAAAWAGIPLTHRDHASDLTLATGHDLLSARGSHTDWNALACATGTVVLFMAAKRLAENLARLVAHGRAPTTPAAYVSAACTAQQRVVVGTLDDLARRVARAHDIVPEQPALILVGDVVSLRAKLKWVESRPLFGRRVLVARARPGASHIATDLRALGAEVLEAPAITVEPLDDYASLDRALTALGRYDALVFACAEGVAATLERIGARGLDVRLLPPIPIVAVGAQARDRLRAAGLHPAVFVPGACRDAVANASLLTGRLLVLTGKDGRPNLVAELASLGADVEGVATYAVRRTWPRVFKQPFDAVVLPSSSAAAQLYASELGAALRDTPAIVIGPTTEAAARRHGAAHLVRAAADTIGAAVASTHALLSARLPARTSLVEGATA